MELSLDYPTSFHETPISADLSTAGYVFRAEEENPPALISMRRQLREGMLKAKVGTLKDNLIEEINRRYPDRFPEYKKEKFDEIIVTNEKSLLFEFTYLGADNKTRMKQRLIVIPRVEDAFLVSFQSKESDFNGLIPIWDKIQKSFH
ncbi:MAG: hypothetical protein IPJ69_15020 [Deltaproteobacteria bacterium]|nr:MAG: hypothetical protein IPJ69_15020 [Deltaproteobacteria bacterium]